LLSVIPTDTIYLDHAATTPVDPTVVEVMLPYFTEQFGNPSSIYQLGQDARAALDRARATVSRILNCQPSEILFTSGATESDNLALAGVVFAKKRLDAAHPAHIITTTVEHHAVLHIAEWLESFGVAVTYVPSDAAGIVDPDAIRQAIRPDTCLISVMYVNNETGAIQPIEAISRIAREAGIPFHTDAVQAAGSLSLDVDLLGIDLMSLTGHKFYGPKGIGMLYIRRGTEIAYQQLGGGQESGRRGGTENVPLIAGQSIALERADAHRADYVAGCQELRNTLWEGLLERVPDIELNGPLLEESRLANNLNFAIPGVQGETALLSLDMLGIAASAGSACTTGNAQPSHVLKAMGFSDDRCRESLRLTVGRCNTPDQIDEAIDVLGDAVSRIRVLSDVS
jgi:cysteine desulfurase